MNPQNMPREQIKGSCERENIDSDRKSIITDTVKKLTTAAIAACSLNIAQPQEAQAQETHRVEPAVLIIPQAVTWNEWLTVEEIQALRDRLVEDVLNQEKAGTGILEWVGIPNNINARDIVWAIYMYGDDALIRSFEGFFAATHENSTEAAAIIYPKLPRNVLMAVEHSHAIELGRQIYVENALKLDERYNSGRLARAPEDIKIQSAKKSFDHTFAAILRSDIEALDSDSLTDIAYYAPDFVEVYLMNPIFTSDFPQKYLENAIQIAESRERTADLAAEWRRYREETRTLFREMAEIIRQKRSTS